MAMEIFNGVVMRTIDPRPHVSFRGWNRIPCEVNFPDSNFCAKSLRRRAVVGEPSAFDDERHKEYYNSCAATTCGEEVLMEKMMKKKKKKKKKKKEVGVSAKKRAKLEKDLMRNLRMFSELGFGLESDEAKVKAISEAAMVLQAHLEHLRAQGVKLEKEGKMVAAMDDSESSSSSESSDSECEEDVTVNISTLGNQEMLEESVNEEVVAVSLDTSGGLKRVEVCTGKKCTKMGAAALVGEFQNALGVEGSVAECKCLGKCKTAPNVRIRNSGADDDSVRSPGNPLCLGVGLDDVASIAANYFGKGAAGAGASADSAALPSA